MKTPLELKNLRLAKLSGEGFRYVREMLHKGGPLASIVPLSNGEVFTLLPARAKAERLNYHEGGVLSPEEAFEAQQAMCSLLQSYVDLNASNIVLFEDQSFRLGDPAVGDDDYVFECADVLYHFRNKETGQRTDNQFADSIGVASQYPTIILLGTAEGHIPRRTTLSESRVRDLVNDVRHIFVGSYDEEGFVIWSKCSDELLPYDE